MSLSRNRVNAQIAVSDRSEAERFYEGTLGLAKGEGSREASWRYPCGDGSVLSSEKGIHDSGYGKVAWFKDPDGNTFALEQI